MTGFPHIGTYIHWNRLTQRWWKHEYCLSRCPNFREGGLEVVVSEIIVAVWTGRTPEKQDIHIDLYENSIDFALTVTSCFQLYTHTQGQNML